MRSGLLSLAALFISSAAFAQSSPGPYVVDLRGALVTAPTGTGFYYVLPPNTLAPTRSFGLQGGAHIYLIPWGGARIGLGAEGLRTRGTAKTQVAKSSAKASTSTTTTTPSPDVDTSMEISSVTGQVSFNFGGRDGWSYLTAGYGNTRTRSDVSNEVPGPITHSVVVLKRHTPTTNFGGGARWFIRSHLGVGFDIRFHRLSASEGYPSKQIVALSVGVSVR